MFLVGTRLSTKVVIFWATLKVKFFWATLKVTFFGPPCTLFREPPGRNMPNTGPDGPARAPTNENTARRTL